MTIKFSVAQPDAGNQDDDVAGDKLLDSLQYLEPYLSGAAVGFVATGLTLRPAQGGGWIAVVKLVVNEEYMKATGEASPAPGNYVVFGAAKTMLGALCAVDHAFGDGSVRLTPDKFASEPPAKRSPSKGYIPGQRSGRSK